MLRVARLRPVSRHDSDGNRVDAVLVAVAVAVVEAAAIPGTENVNSSQPVSSLYSYKLVSRPQ